MPCSKSHSLLVVALAKVFASLSRLRRIQIQQPSPQLPPLHWMLRAMRSLTLAHLPPSPLCTSVPFPMSGPMEAVQRDCCDRHRLPLSQFLRQRKYFFSHRGRVGPCPGISTQQTIVSKASEGAEVGRTASPIPEAGGGGGGG